MFETLNEWLEVITVFFRGYCLQYFVGSFLERRKKTKRLCGLLVMAGYGVLKLGSNFLLPSGLGSISIIENMALTALILFGLVFCFYKAANKMTIFLVITFMAVNEISIFLSYMVIQAGNLIIDLWIWLMDLGYISSLRIFEILVNITAVVLQILMSGIFMALLYMMLKKITGSFREKDHDIQRAELYFLLTPGLAGLLLCIFLRTIMVTVENGVPEMLYDKYPVLILLIPAILILSLVSVYYGVKLFQNMIAMNREMNSRIILEKQIDNMQNHMEEMERIYSGVRNMKHDMKNTLAVIMQLAGKNGETEHKELQNYLAELNQNFDSLECRFHTGNTVVDILMNMKYHEVIEIIPDIQINAERLLFPDSLQIQSYDIGIIIGNALDNAIEACEILKNEQPEADTFISFSSFMKGKMVLIEVENSFNGRITTQKQSELPETNKSDKLAHGMGLLNIKNTAEKYHGAMDWSVNDNIFTLSVMMKNEYVWNRNGNRSKIPMR